MRTIIGLKPSVSSNHGHVDFALTRFTVHTTEIEKGIEMCEDDLDTAISHFNVSHASRETITAAHLVFIMADQLLYLDSSASAGIDGSHAQ